MRHSTSFWATWDITMWRKLTTKCTSGVLAGRLLWMGQHRIYVRVGPRQAYISVGVDLIQIYRLNDAWICTLARDQTFFFLKKKEKRKGSCGIFCDLQRPSVNLLPLISDERNVFEGGRNQRLLCTVLGSPVFAWRIKYKPTLRSHDYLIESMSVGSCRTTSNMRRLRHDDARGLDLTTKA